MSKQLPDDQNVMVNQFMLNTEAIYLLNDLMLGFWQFLFRKQE